jgi:hypothetical protein
VILRREVTIDEGPDPAAAEEMDGGHDHVTFVFAKGSLPPTVAAV